MSAELKRLRLNQGLTVGQLAERADVPEHVVRHAENGGRPRPANAMRIAAVFGLTVTDLWPLPDPAPTEAAA